MLRHPEPMRHYRSILSDKNAICGKRLAGISWTTIQERVTCGKCLKSWNAALRQLESESEMITCPGCKGEIGFLFHEWVITLGPKGVGMDDEVEELAGAGVCEVCGRDWSELTAEEIEIIYRKGAA